jgi:hypothetical protein
MADGNEWAICLMVVQIFFLCGVGMSDWLVAAVKHG